MARGLLLAVILAGGLFVALTDPTQRLYTVALSLQDRHWPTGAPITLPLDQDNGGRAYYLPADVVQHYRRFPAWMSDYHWRLAQAGAIGLMLAGVLHALLPYPTARPRRDRTVRHVRGPQILMRRRVSRWHPAIRCWLALGAGLSLMIWLFQYWQWLGFDGRAFSGPGLWWGFQQALANPTLRAGTIPALIAGYGAAALAVATWRRVVPPAHRGGLTLGGVPLAVAKETRHYLIGGRTGGGKTQAIQELLRPLRASDEAAMLADPGGGYLSRFYREGDLVLNLFDQRSVAWSPFAEIEQPYDCERLAKAAIPDAASPVNQEWHFYAQSLLSAILKAMVAANQRSVRILLQLVSVAPAEELSQWLAGSPTAILTASGNAKMLSNTRAIIATYLSGWQYLKDTGAFSIRRWVRADGARPWLYLTYLDDQKALLRHLIAAWLDIAVVEALSLTEDHDRRLWFVLDELDSLGKVATLKDGLTNLRKRGGGVIAGLQTIAQLRTTYGRDEAQTLLSSMLNKLVLGVGDGETANYFQTEIGQRDVKREEVSANHGVSGARGTRNRSKVWRQQTEWLVLASEIQGLPDRQGYLRQAGEMNWHRVTIPLVSMPTTAEPFERAPDVVPLLGKTDLAAALADGVIPALVEPPSTMPNPTPSAPLMTTTDTPRRPAPEQPTKRTWRRRSTS